MKRLGLVEQELLGLESPMASQAELELSQEEELAVPVEQAERVARQGPHRACWQSRPG